MAFVDTQECLLDDVLRRGTVSRHPIGDGEKTIALGTSQRLEGTFVSRLSRGQKLGKVIHASILSTTPSSERRLEETQEDRDCPRKKALIVSPSGALL